MLSSPFKPNASSSASPASLFSFAGSLQFKSTEMTNSPAIGGALTPHSPSFTLFSCDKWASPYNNEFKWHPSMFSPLLTTPIQLKSSYKLNNPDLNEKNKISSFDSHICEPEVAEEQPAADALKNDADKPFPEMNLKNDMWGMFAETMQNKEEARREASQPQKLFEEENEVNQKIGLEEVSDKSKEKRLFKKEARPTKKWVYFEQTRKKNMVCYDLGSFLDGWNSDFVSEPECDDYLLNPDEEEESLSMRRFEIESLQFLRGTQRNLKPIHLRFDSRRLENRNLEDQGDLLDWMNEEEGERGQVLKKKISKEEGNVNFECEICGKVFLKGSSLGGHKAKAHQEISMKLAAKRETRKKRTADRVRGKVLRKECAQQLQEN